MHAQWTTSQWKIATYSPTKSWGILSRANHTAEKRHRSQWRRTGERFSTHLHSTEHILVVLGFIKYIVIRVAAKLHDLIEDSADEVKDEVRAIILLWFGERVLRIVEALTKKPGADYFAQLLDAVVEGLWEVAFVKAADRLHNVTTIHGFNNYKKEISYFEETLGPLLQFFAEARCHIPVEHVAAYEDLILSVIDLTAEMEKKSRQRERERDLGYFSVV